MGIPKLKFGQSNLVGGGELLGRGARPINFLLMQEHDYVEVLPDQYVPLHIVAKHLVGVASSYWWSRHRGQVLRIPHQRHRLIEL